MEWGKRLFTSDTSISSSHPSWNDTFTVSLIDESSVLDFKIISRDTNDNYEQQVDFLQISGVEIRLLLLENKYIIDHKTSSAQNKFTYSVRYKGDGSSKVKNITSKLDKKEELYQTKVVPDYESAKYEYEKILNSTGIELLNNWGILGSEFDWEDILNSLKQPQSDKPEPHLLKKDK